MACSGAHCSNHYGGCNYHRPPCAANRPLATPRPNPGDKATQFFIEDLRTKVQAEIALYKSNPIYAWVPMEANDPAIAGQVINENNMYTELDRMMDRVLGWSGTTPNQQGRPVTWIDFLAVCNEYDIVRTNCICHSDMGPLICTCHNDCGCNYSDARLKKEIIYC